MRSLIRKGRAWRFGDNVDTDQIFPSKYMHLQEPHEAAKHLMEGADVEFPKHAKRGDFIVAGKNFGLGSIRGGVHLALEHLKLGGILAHSFSRAFFRSCISEGIPVMECPRIRDSIHAGDIIQVNFSNGLVENLTKKKITQGNRLPEFMINKIRSGGSIASIKKTLGLKPRRARRKT